MQKSLCVWEKVVTFRPWDDFKVTTVFDQKTFWVKTTRRSVCVWWDAPGGHFHTVGGGGGGWWSRMFSPLQDFPLWQQTVRQRIQTQPLQGFGVKEKLYRLMGLLNRRWAKSRTPHWNRQTEEERPGGSYGSKKCPVTLLGNMGKRGGSLKKMLSPESPDPFV